MMESKSLARQILITAFVAWLPAAFFAVYWFRTLWALPGCFAGFFPLSWLTATTPNFEIAAVLAMVFFLGLAAVAWWRPRLWLSVALAILIVLSTCSFLVRMRAYRANLLSRSENIHLYEYVRATGVSSELIALSSLAVVVPTSRDA